MDMQSGGNDAQGAMTKFEQTYTGILANRFVERADEFLQRVNSLHQAVSDGRPREAVQNQVCWLARCACDLQDEAVYFYQLAGNDKKVELAGDISPAVGRLSDALHKGELDREQAMQQVSDLAGLVTTLVFGK